MYKLGLNVQKSDALTPCEQIAVMKRCGFQAFFSPWDVDVAQCRAAADALGMIYHSVHAPFHNIIRPLWFQEEDRQRAIRELKDCVDRCRENNVAIMVVHAYSTFQLDCPITRQAIDNFREVVDYAGQNNVKIAFENLQGEKYLIALMDAFAEYDHVGICWDSGHEHCYHPWEQLLKRYGNRLLATHLNDNMGITHPEGVITGVDDRHLLPFTGTRDWVRTAQLLRQCRLPEVLTFELKCAPTNNAGTLEAYITKCYAAARKFSQLMEK